MSEVLQPGRDQSGPVRVLFFEPHERFRQVIAQILEEAAAVVTPVGTVEEAREAIEVAYQGSPNPFDRALLAPGRTDGSIYPAERIIYMLTQRGMDRSAIALHSSRPLEDLALFNGVTFLYKGDDPQEVRNFLSLAPQR